ncbi:uncharacterized protein LOC132798654 isoform X2 [Drosophila nasuta]|uniref:Uncharacterized protein LOC117563596 isoform X2 n=1 Tax=Drosophila albomicans TaxID=7291 RepID=A0A6P8W2J1_DROAB|nr:uncharacterized protein LOC117563596 isoform X2 [Drosophila albomicans]XP_060666577.1 uncharacterized protein LOC132798654 isoform X2 [Drosophila nasuta]
MYLGQPVIFLGLCCFLLTHHCAQGQANKVSSKLDFDDMENNNNNQTGVPVIIGQGQGQGQGQQGNSGSGYDQGTGRAGSSGSGGGDGGGGGSGSSASGNSGHRPKIHGVRVTVDTGDGQQQTKESKESVEITDLGKHKKRVGIHTDITFEITAEGEGNETSSAQQRDGEKEDASVPIFKGRASSSRGDSKHQSRDPYDPKAQWNPNYATEHRGLDAGNRAGSRSSSDSYYPQYYPQHVYTSDSSDVGGIYRNGETWTHYVPVWTTERSPHEQSQLQRRPSWKPCYCMASYGTDYRRRRASKTTKGIKGPSRRGIVKSQVHKVDSKLEQPFS